MSAGGVGRYGRELAAALAALAGGPEIVVLDRSIGPPFTPWGRRRVGRAAARAGADLIHGLHLEVPGASVPTVATVPDLIPLDHPASMPSPLRRAAYRRLLAQTVERADRLVVPGPSTRDRLISFGADAARITVVPNGVGSGFRPSTDAERAQARARFAAGRRYVAAVAGSRAHKNLAGLQRAATVLHERIDEPVVALGPRLPGAGALEFAGWLSEADLRSFYAGAEVLMVPSHVEGFGLPALEAMACGTPVVCGSGLGGLAFLAAGAVVVDVGRPTEVADAVERLLADDASRLALAGAARRAAESLTTDATAERTLAVYREALAVA